MQRLRAQIVALHEHGLSALEIARRLGVPRRRVAAMLARRPIFAPRVCEHCGRQFTPTGGRQRYCTPEHRDQHRHDRDRAPVSGRSCEHCGQKFTPTSASQRFCTPEHRKLHAMPRSLREARERVQALESQIARVRDQLAEADAP